VVRAQDLRLPDSTGMDGHVQAGKLLQPSQSGQLSLLPTVGRKISTSQSAAMFCGWGV